MFIKYLKMEISLKFKINWLNIIFNDDFLDYIELGVLIEISMMSKFVREKFNPRLFRNLELSTNITKFKFKDNIFIEYANWKTDLEFTNLFNDYYRYFKGLSVENGLNDFTRSLKHIKKYTKSFCIKDAKKAEHYLFPIIKVFNSLTTLRLDSCIIPLFEFNMIGKSLLNLKRLDMRHVILYKSPTDNFKSKKLILPTSLEHLDFNSCYIGRCNVISDPYKFVLNQYGKVTISKLDLPSISMPNLKILGYENINERPRLDFTRFLAKNQNLESLKIESSRATNIQELKSLKCLELLDMDEFYITEHYPTLKSTLRLSVDRLYPKNYVDVKKLCSFCPNLQNLRLNMRNGDHITNFIDILILPSLSNLNLKELELRFIAKKDEKLDFTKINNIESLVIESESYTLLAISFNTSSKLKKVKLVSNSGKVNTQEFKDKFNSYDNWSFKFSPYNINGYKIN
jgi:hypothetical protein